MVNISNPSGDRNDKIANAAKVLGRSDDRKKIFRAIYTGKKKKKTITEISNISGITNKVRVLQETKKLCSEDIIQAAEKINGETTYQKIDFYTHNKNKIISLATNKKKLDSFPTKVSPKVTSSVLNITLPQKLIDVKEITIDDIDSFKKVKPIKSSSVKSKPIYEKKIKLGLKKILGEKGKFIDWGGETDDVFTNRVVLNGKRISTSFGLKGRGTKGSLTPKKMGKNGDQIQRLFRSSASIFFVQYYSQIDASIIEQLKQFAIAKSAIENRRIYYGVIDGIDTQRIIAAYPNKFK